MKPNIDIFESELLGVPVDIGVKTELPKEGFKVTCTMPAIPMRYENGSLYVSPPPKLRVEDLR